MGLSIPKTSASNCSSRWRRPKKETNRKQNANSLFNPPADFLVSRGESFHEGTSGPWPLPECWQCQSGLTTFLVGP